MKSRYPHLLSPLKIGNVTLKDRMCFPNASPHFLQGPEIYPSTSYRKFHALLAKNGAAYIVMAPWSNPLQRKVGAGDSLRMQNFDLSDPSVTNYFAQMTDDVHFYGGKMSIASDSIVQELFPEGYSFSGGKPLFALPGWPVTETKMLQAECFGQLLDSYLDRLAIYHECGFDMTTLNISNWLNPHANTRPDEYGVQTPENAARFPKLVFKAIRDRFGPDFLIDVFVYGEIKGAYTAPQLAEILKRLEGCYDILSIKEKDAAANHPTGYQFTKGYHPNLEYARIFKEAGIKTPIALNGGYQDPDELEEYLAEGRCELFSMARGFFTDFDYYEKMVNGDAEDITPCLWCNKCHGTMGPPWLSVCSVNPEFGFDLAALDTIPAKTASKKVAIVGGGPIGMRAAIMAAERGHQVTLFEKTGYLGGQLRHSDYVSFKWPLRDYKGWLIRQLEKKNVLVRMNTEATPELIANEGFDAVIAAIGAKPRIPKFAQNEMGELKEGLVQILDVFGNEDKLGQRVVIVGGSETGVETGMHLCEMGKEVTVLTRQFEIAHDASHLHSITMAIIDFDENGREIIRAAWEKYPRFHSVVNATTTEVTAGSVSYTDENGVSHTIEADTVVICGGMEPRHAEANAFFGSAERFAIAGDCEKVANLQVGNRAAMGRVVQI